MTHEDLPVQMLARLMRVGQLLASVEPLVPDEKADRDKKRELEEKPVERNVNSSQKRHSH